MKNKQDKLALLLSSAAILVFLPLLILSQIGTSSVGAINLQPTTAPTDPTAIAMERSRLETEKLAAEIAQLQFENQRNIASWLWNNGAVLAATIVGLFGIIRWLADRQDVRKKHLDERFQAAVESLGSERHEARVQAAIVLLNFLGPGYEHLYKQIFDLSVTNLILHTPKDQDITKPQQALLQALARVFKESYLRAREQGVHPQALDARGVYLAGVPFPSADFEAIQMPEAIISFANLNKATLSSANLHRADLTQTFLEEANLSGATLVQVKLHGAECYRANFEEANLFGAILTGASLTEVNLHRANVSGCDLSFASIGQANLHEANLHGSHARGTIFREATLSSANLTGSGDLTRADFSSATLIGADLRKARLTNANLSSAKLIGTSLSGSDLTNADLSNADLTNANLTNATLIGAKLSRTRYNSGTQWPDGFTPPPDAINTDQL